MICLGVVYLFYKFSDAKMDVVGGGRMSSEAIVKVSLIELIADQFALWLKEKLSLEELEFLKIKLGLEVILINLTKGLVVYGLAITLNVFSLTLILHGSYLLIRNKSYGLHANSSAMCTFMSVLLFVFIPLMIKNIILGPVFVSITFLVAFWCLSKYAPADTEKQPLIGAHNREKLRLQALRRCSSLYVIAFLFATNRIGTMITFGVGIQIIFILPITYKLLKRSYCNYEKYEKECHEWNVEIN